MAKHSEAVERVSWFQSLALVIFTLGKTLVLFSVIALAGGLFLVLPPLFTHSNVFGVPSPSLGIALLVDGASTAQIPKDQLPTLHISTNYTVYGELLQGAAASEDIRVTTTSASGAFGSIPILGAMVLGNDPATGDWRCGITYWSADTRSLISTVDPNATMSAHTAGDNLASIAVGPPQGSRVAKTWTKSMLFVTSKSATNASTSGLLPTGVECLRTVDSIGSDDAGDRWFTMARPKVGFMPLGSDSSNYIAPDKFVGRLVTYSQAVKIVKPKTWTETSGLDDRGGDPASNLVSDQLAAYGDIQLGLPVALVPPGTTLTYVYRDQDVVALNGWRAAVGWLILGAWLSVLLPIVIARFARLRGESLD